jgi:hypothetical protein
VELVKKELTGKGLFTDTFDGQDLVLRLEKAAGGNE